jgi:hypothetical protein
MRNGNKRAAKWKQMEHIGNKMAVLFPIVSIASFLNPQGLGKKPAMRNEAKTVKKTRCDITRGCLQVRQLASLKNVKTDAESNNVSLRGGCGELLRCGSKEE